MESLAILACRDQDACGEGEEALCFRYDGKARGVLAPIGMPSPWLTIPLADYEGHMRSAEVRQMDALSSLFQEALGCTHPASVAVLGVAGGNGLEHIDGDVTKRIAGVDVNRQYLEEVRTRFAGLRGLELYCVDLSQECVGLAPVELVYAALVFEHAGVNLCLDNALSLVAPGGALSAVLQLPSEFAAGVGASAFPSIERLKEHFSLIDPAWFKETLAKRGFKLSHEARRSLPGGKVFWMGLFRSPLSA